MYSHSNYSHTLKRHLKYVVYLIEKYIIDIIGLIGIDTTLPDGIANSTELIK